MNDLESINNHTPYYLRYVSDKNIYVRLYNNTHDLGKFEVKTKSVTLIKARDDLSMEEYWCYLETMY